MATSDISGIKAAKAYVELTLNDGSFQRGLKRCEAEMRAFANKLTSIGAQAFGMGGAMLAPVVVSVKQFAQLDDTLRLVQAVTRGTAREFQMLTDKARLLGKTTSFTSQQVADAMANLGRSGFSSNQIDKMIKHVMNLSRATQTPVAVAAEITGNSMRQFGMQAKDTQKIVDVLTATANNSSQTLEDIATSFKYAAPVAKDFGMAIEETAYYVGILANQGLRGEMAGTSLRNILARLGGEDVKKQFQDVLGINLHDADGQVKKLRDLFLEANEIMKKRGYDALQRSDWFHQTFGLRSMSGGSKLVMAGDQYKALFDAILNSEGEAQRTADNMDKGIGGVIRITISAVQELANVIAEQLNDKLQSLGKWIQQITNKLINFAKYHKGTIITYTKLGATLVKLGAAFFTLGAVLRTTGTLIGGVASLFGVLSIATIALENKFSNLSLSVGLWTEKMVSGRIASKALANSVVDASMAFAGWIPILAAVGVALAGVFLYMRHRNNMKISFSEQEKADDSLRAIEENNRNIAKLIEINKANEKSNEKLNEASDIISDLQKRYGDLGLSIDRVTGSIDGLAEAQERLLSAQKDDLVRTSEKALEEVKGNLKKQVGDMSNMWFIMQKGWSIDNNGAIKNDFMNRTHRAVNRAIAKYGDSFFNDTETLKKAVKEFDIDLGPSVDELTVDDIYKVKDGAGNVHAFYHTGSNQSKFYTRRYREVNEQFAAMRASKQKIFDLTGFINDINANGFLNKQDYETQSVTQEYKTEQWKKAIDIKSTESVLEDIYKNPFGVLPTKEDFQNYRWNVANTYDVIQNEKKAVENTLYELSNNLENKYPDIYSQGKFADTEKTRLAGLFGNLGFLGENKIGDSLFKRGQEGVREFEDEYQKLVSILVAKASEGTESEQKHRRIILQRLSEFHDAYVEALLTGTESDFDFSKWKDIMSYETSTIIKDYIARLRTEVEQITSEIEGKVKTFVENGVTGYRIVVGKDANNKDIYKNGDELLDEAKKDREIENMKAEKLEPIIKESELYSGIGNLINGQERLSVNVSSEDTLRRTQEKTHEYLLEILRKMDRDYNLLKSQTLSEYGLNNPLEDKINAIENERQESLENAKKYANDLREANVDNVNGVPLDQWFEEEIERINKAFNLAIKKAYIDIGAVDFLYENTTYDKSIAVQASRLANMISSFNKMANGYYNKELQKQAKREPLSYEDQQEFIDNQDKIFQGEGQEYEDSVEVYGTEKRENPNDKKSGNPDLTSTRQFTFTGETVIGDYVDNPLFNSTYGERRHNAEEEQTIRNQEKWANTDASFGEQIDIENHKKFLKSIIDSINEATKPNVLERRNKLIDESGLFDFLLDVASVESTMTPDENGVINSEEVIGKIEELRAERKDDEDRKNERDIKIQEMGLWNFILDEVAKEKQKTQNKSETSNVKQPDVENITAIGSIVPNAPKGFYVSDKEIEELGLPTYLQSLTKSYFHNLNTRAGRYATNINDTWKSGVYAKYNEIWLSFLNIYKKYGVAAAYEFINYLNDYTPIVNPYEEPKKTSFGQNRPYEDDVLIVADKTFNDLSLDNLNDRAKSLGIKYSFYETNPESSHTPNKIHSSASNEEGLKEEGFYYNGTGYKFNKDTGKFNVVNDYKLNSVNPNEFKIPENKKIGKATYNPAGEGKQGVIRIGGKNGGIALIPTSMNPTWDKHIRTVKRRIEANAKLNNQLQDYYAGTTPQDVQNSVISQEMRDVSARQELAKRVGDTVAVNDYEKQLAQLESERAENEYYKEVDNISNLERKTIRSNKRIHKLNRSIAIDEKRLENAKTDEMKNKITSEIEVLKKKRNDMLIDNWKANSDLGRSRNFIQSYESLMAFGSKKWDINRNFYSTGSFNAGELNGMDFSTWQAEWKEQTTLLESIDDNLAAMANGEYI